MPVAGGRSWMAPGGSRMRPVLVLAAVLALNGADSATISASAGTLEHAFHIGNTQIGLLLSVVAIGAAALALPAGILTDRTKRTSLLAVSAAGWAVAMLLSGAAVSYLWLLAARAALGIFSATAGPAVASLTGDYFPASSRARIYSFIVGGELVGTGLGFVISGELSAATSWRFAIWWLVVPSLAVAWAVHKLPEPVRGGQREQAGDDKSAARDAADVSLSQVHPEPRHGLVLHSDPADRPTRWAIGYVLRVPTNLLIIIVSALGYFYFAGLRAFAIIYATSHYGLSKAVADVLVLVVGAGAIAGVFAGGRTADWLLRNGRVTARVLVPAVCLLALSFIMAPAVLATSALVAVPLLTAGAFLLGAPNPPMDAARLDIMHPRLWGRAEGVRTVLRTVGEAAAPTLFGYVSQYVFGGGRAATAGGSASQAAHSGAGLEETFLVFLLPLVVAGILALFALRTYPRDVATARASLAATSQTAGQPARPRRRRPRHDRVA